MFEEAQNAVKFLDWLKKFGLAQNILGPVKGQGIRLKSSFYFSYNVGTIFRSGFYKKKSFIAPPVRQ